MIVEVIWFYHVWLRQVAYIQALESKFQIEIKVFKSENRIQLCGVSEDIAEAISEIYEFISKVHEEKHCQMETDSISKEVDGSCVMQ